MSDQQTHFILLPNISHTLHRHFPINNPARHLNDTLETDRAIHGPNVLRYIAFHSLQVHKQELAISRWHQVHTLIMTMIDLILLILKLNVMNTPKTFCFYHQEQAITNFCRDSKTYPKQKNALCLYAPIVSENTRSIMNKATPNLCITASMKC